MYHAINIPGTHFVNYAHYVKEPTKKNVGGDLVKKALAALDLSGVI